MLVILEAYDPKRSHAGIGNEVHCH